VKGRLQAEMQRHDRHKLVVQQLCIQRAHTHTHTHTMSVGKKEQHLRWMSRQERTPTYVI
jgi:hypothetical protein